MSFYRCLPLILVGVVIGAWQPCSAQTNPPAGASVVGQQPQLSPGLVSQVIVQPGRPHLVVVTDPVAKVLAVYQVEPLSGELILKSVRNVSWDLKMLEFNSKKDLSPQDVRAGLPR